MSGTRLIFFFIVSLNRLTEFGLIWTSRIAGNRWRTTNAMVGKTVSIKEWDIQSHNDDPSQGLIRIMSIFHQKLSWSFRVLKRLGCPPAGLLAFCLLTLYGIDQGRADNGRSVNQATVPAVVASDNKAPNRLVPPHSAPSVALLLSDNPTQSEIQRVRLFVEPLIPIGVVPSSEQNRRVASALRFFANRQTSDDFGSIEDFLAQNPDSPWSPSLMFNLGMEFYNTGSYSKEYGAVRRTSSPDEAERVCHREIRGGQPRIWLAQVGRCLIEALRLIEHET